MTTYAPRLIESTDPNTASHCPECNGPPVVEGTETICQDCGLVLDHHAIDHGPEWRAFERDERARTGPPSTNTRHDTGLGTEIGHDPGLPFRQRREHYRGKFQTKADRNRAYAFGEIHRLHDQLGGPDVIRDTACQLVTKAQDADLIHGRSLEGIASAAIIAAARIHTTAAPFTTVADVARVDEQHIRTCYTALVAELGVPVPPPNPVHLVPPLCEAVGVERENRMRAEQLVRAHATDLAGCKPASIVAAAIYIATGKAVTQATLAEAADVTAVTIRKLARQMEGQE